MLTLISSEILRVFDSSVLTAIFGAIFGTVFGGMVTFSFNLIFNIFKERNYRRAFMFSHKLKLLELPTYLEGATYLEDYHGHLPMSTNLKSAEPRVRAELTRFSENIESIFAQSNSMYLRSKDIKVLNKLYDYAGILSSRITIDGIEFLEEESKVEDPLKEIAALYFIEIRKLDGPDENIAYNNGLQVEI
mgnify:CR=1 FL=1